LEFITSLIELLCTERVLPWSSLMGSLYMQHGLNSPMGFTSKEVHGLWQMYSC